MNKIAVLAFCLIAAVASANLFAPVAENIIAQVNRANTTWKAGVNKRFANMTMDDVKKQLGALQSPKNDRLPLKNVAARNDIPASFDARTAWPNCQSLQEVRDQSSCGSCWAISAVEAFSDRICVASNQTLQTRISTQDLLTCCGFTCGQGCNGGYPQSAWRWFKTKGAVTGDLFGDNSRCQAYSLPPCDHHVNGTYGPCPAEVSTPKCVKQCASGYPKTYADDKWFVSEAYSLPNNVAKIQSDIMTHGSVQVSLTVYADFLTYQSGVYQHQAGSALGGHAVKCVGWGVDNGTPYWIIVNSWNEGWGNKGTINILRGSNECGIEGSVVAGTPILQRVSKKTRIQRIREFLGISA